MSGLKTPRTVKQTLENLEALQQKIANPSTAAHVAALTGGGTAGGAGGRQSFTPAYAQASGKLLSNDLSNAYTLLSTLAGKCEPADYADVARVIREFADLDTQKEFPFDRLYQQHLDSATALRDLNKTYVYFVAQGYGSDELAAAKDSLDISLLELMKYEGNPSAAPAYALGEVRAAFKEFYSLITPKGNEKGLHQTGNVIEVMQKWAGLVNSEPKTPKDSVDNIKQQLQFIEQLAKAIDNRPRSAMS